LQIKPSNEKVIALIDRTTADSTQNRNGTGTGKNALN